MNDLFLDGLFVGILLALIIQTFGLLVNSLWERYLLTVKIGKQNSNLKKRKALREFSPNQRK